MKKEGLMSRNFKCGISITCFKLFQKTGEIGLRNLVQALECGRIPENNCVYHCITQAILSRRVKSAIWSKTREGESERR